MNTQNKFIQFITSKRFFDILLSLFVIGGLSFAAYSFASASAYETAKDTLKTVTAQKQSLQVQLNAKALEECKAQENVLIEALKAYKDGQDIKGVDGIKQRLSDLKCPFTQPIK